MQPTASLSRACAGFCAEPCGPDNRGYPGLVRHSLAPGGGQPRGVPETVVVVFGQVGSLKQRVILPGGQGGWPQKH
jgi:hypothetical protein